MPSPPGHLMKEMVRIRRKTNRYCCTSSSKWRSIDSSTNLSSHPLAPHLSIDVSKYIQNAKQNKRRMRRGENKHLKFFFCIGHCSLVRWWILFWPGPWRTINYFSWTSSPPSTAPSRLFYLLCNNNTELLSRFSSLFNHLLLFITECLSSAATGRCSIASRRSQNRLGKKKNKSRWEKLSRSMKCSKVWLLHRAFCLQRKPFKWAILCFSLFLSCR